MELSDMAGIGASEWLALILGVALAAGVFGLRHMWRRGKARRRGRRGERMVAAELSGLGRRKARVLNDVTLPGVGGTAASSQIDHVVVSRYGIFVIETKSHAGRITGSEHGQYWTQHLASQSNRFYNPLLQNSAHIRRLHRLLPDIDAGLFVSMTVFTQAWRLDIKAEDITVPRRFRADKHIRRTFIPSERRKGHWWSRSREVVLDETCVVVTTGEMLDEMTRRPKVVDPECLEEITRRIEEASLHGAGAEREHRRYARSRSRENELAIRRGICPRCGGRLEVMDGPRGEFAGCENYPQCRFSCSIDLLGR